MDKPVRFRLLDLIGIGEEARALLRRLDAGDRDTRLIEIALERLMISFGEAVRRLPPTVLAREPDVPWRRIVDMRHVLVHDYDNVDDVRILNAVRDALPAALAAIERLLAEEPPQ